MKLNPYLAFDGRCREAFEFYREDLGWKNLFHTDDRRIADGVKHAA